MRADLTELDRTTSEGAGRARRIAFLAASVVFIIMHLVLSPLPYAVLGWFLEGGAISHRIHEVCFGLIFVVTAAGVLAQLRRPERKIAAMYQVVIPLYLIILSVLLIDNIVDPIVIAFIVAPIVLIVLHPDRKGLLRPQTDPSRLLLAVAAVAAIPLVVFAVGQVREGAQASKLAPEVLEDLPDTATAAEIEDALAVVARTPAELEAVQHFGHWSAMGAFAGSIMGLSIVAALRMRGWRLPAWAAAIAAIVFGTASLVAQGDASALSTPWAVAAIVWGITFAGTAEYVHRQRNAI